MKKFLSLVLALVMTMSLVTVSAGAVDFTDDSDIDYEEAVDVISALGIVDGYSDDSFRPDGSLTRGAAAKIICNLILGPTTASALSATTAPFKDVPVTNTFAGYITYCSQQGIISGYGDGTFRPTGSLTGNAFMKMLLGALGYDSSIEGYTGANWQVNVVKQAVGIGLDDGNDDFVGSRTVTRQEAALYAFNMIKADMVQYDSKTTVNVNGATVTVAGDKAEPIPQAGSGCENTMGDGTGTGADAVVQFAERYFPRLTKTTNNTDAFGRPANEWRYGSEVIGLYADDSDLIATYTAKAEKGDLYDLVGSSIARGIENGTYQLDVCVNGEWVANPAAADYFDRNSTAAAGLNGATRAGTGESGNGILTEVYLDDNSDVTIVMVNTYLMKATSDYNATRELVTVEQVVTNDSITLPNLPATLEQEDFDVDGVQEGDYLLVTYSYDSGDVESVQPAELLTGTVTEYTETENVVIAGEKYSYNKLLGTNQKNEQFTINEDATVVMDAYGYIIYVDEAISTSSYVYVQDVQPTSLLGKRAVGAAYFTDGTYDEINIDEYVEANGTSHTSGSWLSTSLNPGWYTFMTDADGDYTLYQVRNPRNAYTEQSDGYTATRDTVVLNSTVRFLQNLNETASSHSDAVRATADTIFIVLDQDEEYTVYTGVESVPNVIESTTSIANDVVVSWVEDEHHYAQYVFIDVSGDANGDVTIDDVNSVADYLFILKSTGNRTVVEGTTYFQYQVVIDGEETTRYIAQDNFAQAGDLRYNVKENSEGQIRRATLMQAGVKATQKVIGLNGTASATISQKGRTVTIAGQDFITNDNTDINLIIGKGCSLLRNSGADYETYLHTTLGTLAGTVAGTYLDATAYVVVDEDDNELAEHIYVYVEQAYDTAQATRYFSDVTFQNSASMAGVTVTFNGESKVMPADGTTNVVFEDVEYTGTGTNMDYTLTATGRVPYTGTVTVDAATETVAAVMFYTVTGQAGYSYSADNVTYLADGADMIIASGETVYVKVTTANTGATASGATLTMVTAPAAGVNAVYSFTAINGAPNFSAATVYSVSVAGGSTQVAGLKVTVPTTVVAGEDVVLNLSGIAAFTGTLTISATGVTGTTPTPSGTLSIFTGTSYNQNFTFTNATGAVTITITPSV